MTYLHDFFRCWNLMEAPFQFWSYFPLEKCVLIWHCANRAARYKEGCEYFDDQKVRKGLHFCKITPLRLQGGKLQQGSLLRSASVCVYVCFFGLGLWTSTWGEAVSAVTVNSCTALTVSTPSAGVIFGLVVLKRPPSFRGSSGHLPTTPPQSCLK